MAGLIGLDLPRLPGCSRCDVDAKSDREYIDIDRSRGNRTDRQTSDTEVGRKRVLNRRESRQLSICDGVRESPTRRYPYRHTVLNRFIYFMLLFFYSRLFSDHV